MTCGATCVLESADADGAGVLADFEFLGTSGFLGAAEDNTVSDSCGAAEGVPLGGVAACFADSVFLGVGGGACTSVFRGMAGEEDFTLMPGVGEAAFDSVEDGISGILLSIGMANPRIDAQCVT